MTPPAPPRRRWFSYSLRTGFALLTLFCVWLGAQVKWIHDRRAARKWLDQNSVKFPVDDTGNAPWPIRLLGEKGKAAILLQNKDRAGEMKRIFPEAAILMVEHEPQGDVARPFVE